MERDHEITGENQQMLTSVKESKFLKSLIPFKIPLPSRYTGEQWRVIRAALESVCLTRKAHKISANRREKILEALEKFPPEIVSRACQIYISKYCATEGKNERYLIGIARNLVKQEEANAPPPVKKIDPLSQWADGARIWSREDMEAQRQDLVEAWEEKRNTDPTKVSRVNRCMHERPRWDWA